MTRQIFDISLFKADFFRVFGSITFEFQFVTTSRHTLSEVMGRLYGRLTSRLRFHIHGLTNIVYKPRLKSHEIS